MSSKNINNLTPAEAERLALLAEECAEVVQIVGKILRHGYDSSNPLVDASPTNKQNLEKELGDVELVVDMLKSCGDVDADAIQHRRKTKPAKMMLWLHYNQDVLNKL